MTSDAKTRISFNQGYAQAMADVAELDVVLLAYKVANLERELEVACVAAADLHRNIKDLEGIIVALQSSLPGN